MELVLGGCRCTLIPIWSARAGERWLRQWAGGRTSAGLPAHDAPQSRYSGVGDNLVGLCAEPERAWRAARKESDIGARCSTRCCSLRNIKVFRSRAVIPWQPQVCRALLVWSSAAAPAAAVASAGGHITRTSCQLTQTSLRFQPPCRRHVRSKQRAQPVQALPTFSGRGGRCAAGTLVLIATCFSCARACWPTALQGWPQAASWMCCKRCLREAQPRPMHNCLLFRAILTSLPQAAPLSTPAAAAPPCTSAACSNGSATSSAPTARPATGSSLQVPRWAQRGWVVVCMLAGLQADPCDS